MATHGWLEGPGLRYISIVCAGTMSSHYHAVVVDNCARLPKFLEHFHKLYAKHQNVLRGGWEAFWASEQTSVVELVKQDDVLAKMIVFPAGTWWLHRFAGVKCADVGATAPPI